MGEERLTSRVNKIGESEGGGGGVNGCENSMHRKKAYYKRRGVNKTGWRGRINNIRKRS